MANAENKNRARFVVQNFGEDPAIISDLVGIPPAIVASAGWCTAKQGVLSKQVAWILTVAPPVPTSLPDELMSLAAMLDRHQEGVARVSRQFDAWIEVEIDRTRLEINPQLITTLARLGVGIRLRWESR